MSHRLKAATYATLATLGQCPQGGPESSFYLALGADLELWNTVRATLQRAGCIEEPTPNYIRPTALGISLGRKIDAAIAAATTN